MAFALVVTNTGEANSGSIWAEYNIEFASPRVPEPVVNTSIVTPAGNAYLTRHSGYQCPVGAGNSFYLAHSSGTLNINDGYSVVNTGSTGGVNWTLVNRALTTIGDIWGSVSNVANVATVLASENLGALVRVYKSITLQ